MKPISKTLLLQAALLLLFAIPSAAQGSYPVLRPLDSIDYNLTPKQSDGLWGYAGSNGVFMIPPVFTEAHRFETVTASDGTSMKVAIINAGGKWGYITSEGIYLIPPKYDSVSDFSNGIASANDNNKYTLFRLHGINKARLGKKILVAAIVAEGISSIRPLLSANLYILETDGRFGVFSEDSNWVIQPRYESILFLDTAGDGVFFLSENGRTCVTNKNGDIIIPATYDSVIYKEDGCFLIKSNGLYGLADNAGNIRIPCQYDEISRRSDNFIFVLKGNKGGLYSPEFNHILQDIYDSIGLVSSYGFSVKSDDKYGLVGIDGDVKIPCILERLPNLEQTNRLELIDNGKLMIYVKGEKLYSVDEYDDILFRRMRYNEYEQTDLLPDWLKKHIRREPVTENNLHYIFRYWADQIFVLLVDENGTHPLENNQIKFTRKDGNKTLAYVLSVLSASSIDGIVPYKLDTFDLTPSGTGNFIKTVGYGYIGLTRKFFTQPVFELAEPAKDGVYNIIYKPWGTSIVGVSFETIQDLDSYQCEDHQYVNDIIRLEDSLFANIDDPTQNIITEFKEEEVVEEEVEEEVIPFQIVETKPSFMGGGTEAFSAWVAQNLIYPEFAKENRVTGKVFVSFTIAPDGSVINVKVVRSPYISTDWDSELKKTTAILSLKKRIEARQAIEADKQACRLLDAEAVRVIKSSPNWTPGTQRGRPVKVSYTMPVVFQLR